MSIIKFKKIHEDAILPEYATEGSSGFDFRSVEDFHIKPYRRYLVSTGLQLADMDSNYEIQIRPRSGLAIKKGVTVLNTPGTIDSDYRGEIKVILINLSDENVYFEKGDKIAQGVVARVEKSELILTEEVKETERGSGGFGSTGNK